MKAQTVPDARGTSPAMTAEWTFALISTSRSAIERQVKRQHIDPWLAQQAQGAALDVLVHELAHAIFRHVARFRNARHLEKRSRRRDVRVETATRRRHQVDRHRRRRVLLLELVDVA